MLPDECVRLLDDWFAGTREDPAAIPARLGYWYASDPAIDEYLADTCGGLAEEAACGELEHWGADPSSRLALILLLDQIPRNLHRGTPRAFENDERALQLCLEGHRWGADAELLPIERVFFWMPLQHAEDLDAQELSVRLFSSLAEEDPEHADIWNGFAGYAILHRDLIARFGRFPHRNEVLGREPTAEESAYLEGGGARFGQ